MVHDSDVRPHENTYWSNEFKEIICKAMKEKVLQHPELMEKLKESKLPFEHYYVFDGKSVTTGYKWLVTEWEIIRGLTKLELLNV